MKWMLVILYFVAGPGGGWEVVDKKFYKTEEECVEFQQFFQQLPAATHNGYMARCQEVEEEV